MDSLAPARGGQLASICCHLLQDQGRLLGMAIARVAGPHAASEVRIHPLRRSALTAPRLAAVPPTFPTFGLLPSPPVAGPREASRRGDRKGSRAARSLRGANTSSAPLSTAQRAQRPAWLLCRPPFPPSACCLDHLLQDLGRLLGGATGDAIGRRAGVPWTPRPPRTPQRVGIARAAHCASCVPSVDRSGHTCLHPPCANAERCLRT